MGNEGGNIQIGINPDRVARNVFICCLVFEIFLVLIDVFINYYELSDIKTIRRLCNIAREDSLASWFGTTQTFIAGLTLWLIFYLARHSSAPKTTAAGWCLLALLFSYMAVDDGAELHERFGTAFEIVFENKGAPDASMSWASKLLDIFPSYAWQILFIPFFGIAGVFMLIFLWRELKHKKAKIIIVLALTCFVTAVGLDFVEGLDKKHEWNFHTMIREKYDLQKYTVRHFSKSLEEFLEMLGITLFWTSFILYFKYLPKGGVRFYITGREIASDSMNAHDGIKDINDKSNGGDCA